LKRQAKFSTYSSLTLSIRCLAFLWGCGKSEMVFVMSKIQGLLSHDG
jgi:hypothetical protein